MKNTWPLSSCGLCFSDPICFSSSSRKRSLGAHPLAPPAQLWPLPGRAPQAAQGVRQPVSLESKAGLCPLLPLAPSVGLTGLGTWGKGST